MEDELAQIRERRMAELQRAAAAPHTMGPVEIDDSTMGAYLENHPIAIVDVWAAWCGPCRMMEPIVEELAHELSGRAGVAKLDADQNYDVLMQYGIQGIPAFLFFKDGQLAGRLVGVQPKRNFVEMVQKLEGKPDLDQALQ